MRAQAPTTDSVPAEQAAPQNELSEIRGAVEQARFEAAEQRAHSLLRRQALTARDRNDTLELLAIAQIAARHEALAQATLAELFARDPEHPQRMRDPGPNVEAFFARVRAAAHPGVAAELQIAAQRDPSARVLIEVRLGPGRDAVDTIHVLARSAPAPNDPARPKTAPFASELGAAARAHEATSEPLHVVTEVGLRERVVLVVPPAEAHATALDFYVEARAPSGHLLGHDGSAAAPLRVRLDPTVRPPPARQATPLRRSWWLWTSVAIVVAGASVTGAVLAH